MVPLIILTGSAGSGKDATANFLVEDHGAVAIAQADPLKRLAMSCFGFSEDQCWGTDRSLKEALDPRFGKDNFGWHDAEIELYNENRGKAWASLVKPEGYDFNKFFNKLSDWFIDLRTEYEDKGLSPRIMLQSLGTEFGRAVNQDLWSDLAIKTAFELLTIPHMTYNRKQGAFLSKAAIPFPDFVVISDGRFSNEILNVKRVGGIAVRVDDPNKKAPAQVGIANHASEVEQFSIPTHYFDLILINDKKAGLGALRQKVSELAADLKHVTVVP